jgi:hypothetical protein
MKKKILIKRKMIVARRTLKIREIAGRKRRRSRIMKRGNI